MSETEDTVVALEQVVGSDLPASIRVTASFLLQYRWELHEWGGNMRATTFHGVPLEVVPADQAWLDAEGPLSKPTIKRKG